MVEINVKGRHVLLTHVGAATAAHVAALVREGAHVTIGAADGPDWPTSLKDLVQRGLVTHDPAAARDGGTGAYDMVIGARRDQTAGQVDPYAIETAAGTPTHPAGRVTLVGGGPGDPGLVTVAGLEALRTADVVVTDRLAPLECLRHVPAGTEIIDVAKIPRGEQTSQERINEVLIEHAAAGKHVVRFKGGDSFVFGRGGEEVVALGAADIPVTVIPGVTSSIAAPELAGIPVTHRGLTQGFTVVSGHVPPGDPRSTLDWDALAHTGTTLVILMGVHTLSIICEGLVARGMDPGMPAAMIADAGLPSQRTVRATVATLPAAVAEAGLGSPAVTVIGPVAGDDLPGTGEVTTAPAPPAVDRAS